jgi:hypothetical protein
VKYTRSYSVIRIGMDKRSETTLPRSECMCLADVHSWIRHMGGLVAWHSTVSDRAREGASEYGFCMLGGASLLSMTFI